MPKSPDAFHFDRTAADRAVAFFGAFLRRIAVERAGGDSFDDFLAGAYTVTHEEPNDE